LLRNPNATWARKAVFMNITGRRLFRKRLRYLRFARISINTFTIMARGILTSYTTCKKIPGRWITWFVIRRWGRRVLRCGGSCLSGWRRRMGCRYR